MRSCQARKFRGRGDAIKYPWGRYVFGLAVIACGICGLVWHDFFALKDVPHHRILTYIMAILELAGGVAVLWPRTVRAGAVAVGVVFLIFALASALPSILQHPYTYAGYGNFFYPFSVVAGTMILYACSGPGTSTRPARLAQIGYYSFGVSLVSFTLEHVFYFHETAVLVPKWILPGQIFWAIVTTVAFALAAIALLTTRMALAAARWTTAMIVAFGLLTWLPALLAGPHIFWSWSETAETFAIAGSAWIVSDLLGSRCLFKPALIAQVTIDPVLP